MVFDATVNSTVDGDFNYQLLMASLINVLIWLSAEIVPFCCHEQKHWAKGTCSLEVFLKLSEEIHEKCVWMEMLSKPWLPLRAGCRTEGSQDRRGSCMVIQSFWRAKFSYSDSVGRRIKGSWAVTLKPGKRRKKKVLPLNFSESSRQFVRIPASFGYSILRHVSSLLVPLW